MKILILYFGIFALLTNMDQTIYHFKVESIDGESMDLSSFKGKKLLIVNVASECGYTPQYAQLQELYESFSEKLVVIGFPSNDFGGQEPGTDEEIKSFCSSRYGVTFPLTTKINIKGNDVHPLYKWLTQKSENGVMDAEVKWNFQKFLIDENGMLYKSLSHKVSPLDDEILQWIQS